MSRVVAFAEKLIESGWLLALVVVPLFFNVYSYRVFEPDKLGLFRTIATLMAALAGILIIENRVRARAPGSIAGPLRAWTRMPLVAVSLATALVYILATAWSVVPRISLMGSYQRLQGTYSTLCYIILFACLLAYLRSREQIDRLLTVIIVTSLPIAMYGLLQHHGLDPLPWQGDVTTRIASTMGNPIFVGAYLIMVIPLTLGRLLEALREFSAERPMAPGRRETAVLAILVGAQIVAWTLLSFSQAVLVALLALSLGLLFARLCHGSLAAAAQASVCGLILSVQLVALLFCGSRGPQVGLLGGLVLFALLAVATARLRRLAIGVVSTGIALLVLLIVMNLPASPLAGARNLPYVGQLGRLMELERGTGKVRTLIWEGAVALLQDDPLRAAIGYGPESMVAVYNRFYPAELAQYESRTASPDRSHNETFDALITTGVMGLAAHLALFVSVLLHGLTSLGMIPDRRSRIGLLCCAATGGALGIGIPYLLEGNLRLSGVGLPVGAIAGIVAYIAARALSGGAAHTTLERWQKLLLISLLATIVAHWIEISVGIAIASTRTYFWVYAALMVCVTRWQPQPSRQTANVQQAGTRASRAGPRSQSRKRRPQQRGSASTQPKTEPFPLRPTTLRAIAMAILLSIVVTTLIWDLTGNPDGVSSASRILAATVSGGSGRVALWQRGPLWMALTLVAAAAATTVSSWKQSVERTTVGENLAVGAMALGVPLTFGLVYAVSLASSLRPPVDTATLLSGYLIMLGVAVMGIATALYFASPREGHARIEWRAIVYGVLLAGASMVAWRANVRPILADVVYKQGLRYDGALDWQQAAESYELASTMAPYEDYYLLFAGRARLEQARAATDAARRNELFEEALLQLERARALNPLNTDHAANLARAHRSWAEAEPDASLKAERLTQALEYYAQAVALSPQNAQIYNEWGMTYGALGDVAQARARYEESLALDDQYAITYLLLGDLHLDAQEWSEAIALYETASELTADSVAAWSRLAYAYAKAERWEDAIAANLAVLDLAPEDYITLRNLVYIYHTQQDYGTALIYLDRALAVATGDEAASLRALRQQLVQQ
ncbi:MAG: O-antigen ligase family protein [Anaerolineae bacterium]